MGALPQMGAPCVLHRLSRAGIAISIGTVKREKSYGYCRRGAIRDACIACIVVIVKIADSSSYVTTGRPLQVALRGNEQQREAGVQHDV